MRRRSACAPPVCHDTSTLSGVHRVRCTPSGWKPVTARACTVWRAACQWACTEQHMRRRHAPRHAAGGTRLCRGSGGRLWRGCHRALRRVLLRAWLACALVPANSRAGGRPCRGRECPCRCRAARRPPSSGTSAPHRRKSPQAAGGPCRAPTAPRTQVAPRPGTPACSRVLHAGRQGCRRSLQRPPGLTSGPANQLPHRPTTWRRRAATRVRPARRCTPGAGSTMACPEEHGNLHRVLGGKGEEQSLW